MENLGYNKCTKTKTNTGTLWVPRDPDSGLPYIEITDVGTQTDLAKAGWRFQEGVLHLPCPHPDRGLEVAEGLFEVEDNLIHLGAIKAKLVPGNFSPFHIGLHFETAQVLRDYLGTRTKIGPAGKMMCEAFSQRLTRERRLAKGHVATVTGCMYQIVNSSLPIEITFGSGSFELTHMVRV